ncbi:hypothetical protein RRSWK_04315 [Rhodopirellula sp. SWK7]|nr:hypothetical protein RRSWK_04315 [Rhodopirellula sp. SWK7]
MEEVSDCATQRGVFAHPIKTTAATQQRIKIDRIRTPTKTKEKPQRQHHSRTHVASMDRGYAVEKTFERTV